MSKGPRMNDLWFLKFTFSYEWLESMGWLDQMYGELEKRVQQSKIPVLCGFR